MNLYDYVATIPDFPKEGIMFRDVTPLFQNGEAFKYVIEQLKDYAKKINADVVCGPEARGYILGAPISTALNIGFVPIRKPGKLPRETISYSYDLEYGSNTLELHKDAIKPGQKVLIVDDLLATGGTVEASAKLVEQLGGEVVGCAFIIELVDLKGREVLKNYDVYTMMTYEGE